MTFLPDCKFQNVAILVSLSNSLGIWYPCIYLNMFAVLNFELVSPGGSESYYVCNQHCGIRWTLFSFLFFRLSGPFSLGFCKQVLAYSVYS